MPQIQLAQIPGALRAGAVGIGEQHNMDQGRRLVAGLIVSGLVRHLFIEVAPNHQKLIDTAAESAVSGGSWGNLLPKIGTLDADQNENAKPFGIIKLVAFALTRGVKVHCADDGIVYFPQRSTSATGMTRRNKTTVSKFSEITGQAADPNPNPNLPAAIGCVLLGGTDHYNGKEGNGTSIPSLLAGLNWADSKSMTDRAGDTVVRSEFGLPPWQPNG